MWAKRSQGSHTITILKLSPRKYIPTAQLSQCHHKIHNFNPLTTNDEYSRHRNSAACYQLAQSVLKIGSALAERVEQGEVGGATTVADHAWRLLQLAIEKARSALDSPLFLVQTGIENGPSTL